jgi:NADH-ubiquinone oxidoreductase chain 4
MSLLILILVLIREINKVLNILRQCLVLICIIFFFSSNLLSLFIFFELSIFPIILIILGYGSQIEKINSSYYLIFYASFCSFPFLFIYFYYDLSLQFVYFMKFLRWELTLFLTLGFIMKFPVYFLHLWLPKAHVEAPTSASILLAGLLLKLGTVGFFRIIKVLTFTHINFWYYLSFLGMVLSSFNCAFQSDSKSLAAYSSVTHIGFTLLCLILFSMESKVSSLILMLAHGFTSTLIFYFIGEFYHGSNTRIIYYFNSFINLSILLTLFFTLTFISNAGVPPSISFISEFLSILVLFNLNKIFTIVIIFYFFFAFYYRIYFITNFLIGKKLLELDLWKAYASSFHLFLIFNIFWLSVII